MKRKTHPSVHDGVKKYPAPNQEFNLIATSITLHHVPNTGHILCVFHDLLKPGVPLHRRLGRKDGSFHGPGVDLHHGLKQTDLSRRAVQAGLADIQFQTVFGITKAHEPERGTIPCF